MRNFLITFKLRGKELSMNKLSFQGTIRSTQPRIRLTRSFDEASHTYLGYAIKIAGTIDNQQATFSIGIGNVYGRIETSHNGS